MKTIAIDFDGTIYSYKSGWLGADKLPDPPVEGAKSALKELKNRGYRIVVFSHRATDSAGKEAIKKWLDEQSIKVNEVTDIKPSAEVYIDDRGLKFEGDWSKTLNEAINFKNWLKE